VRGEPKAQDPCRSSRTGEWKPVLGAASWQYRELVPEIPRTRLKPCVQKYGDAYGSMLAGELGTTARSMQSEALAQVLGRAAVEPTIRALKEVNTSRHGRTMTVRWPFDKLRAFLAAPRFGAWHFEQAKRGANSGGWVMQDLTRPKSFGGESLAGVELQVALKFQRLRFIREGEVSREFPRTISSRVRTAAGIEYASEPSSWRCSRRTSGRGGPSFAEDKRNAWEAGPPSPELRRANFFPIRKESLEVRGVEPLCPEPLRAASTHVASVWISP